MCDAAATSLDVGLSRKFTAPFKVLQYADDTLIFATVKGPTLQKLALVLQAFSQATGLAINNTKSIFVPINLSDTQANSVRNVIKFTLAELPITYLGMTLNSVQPDKASFMPLFQKINRRLDGWRGKLLSRPGKIQLCKSVISAIPVYNMSCFKLPSWLINDIDKVRRNFIWSKGTDQRRGMSLVSWTLVCLPKKNGGLGLSDFRLQNLALLTRWWWRLYSRENSLWKENATAIFCNSSNGSRPISWRKKGSFFWAALTSIKYIFLFSTNWIPGNGQRISFWTDNWGYGNFSLLYAKLQSPPATCMHCALSFAKTNATTLFPRPLQQHLPPLLAQLHSLTLPRTTDVIQWKWTSSGSFSTASIYNILVTAGKSSSNLLMPWNFKVTPSIQLFCFFLQRNRLLTHQRLSRWNIPFHSGCSLCSSTATETSMYLFLQCDFSSRLWQILSSRTDIVYQFNEQECSVLFMRIILSSTPLIGKNWAEVLAASALWCLWKECNNRIFRSRRQTVEATVEEVLFCSNECLKNC